MILEKVTLVLHSARWKVYRVPRPTRSGGPLYALAPARTQDAGTPPVWHDEVSRWLLVRGFDPHDDNDSECSFSPPPVSVMSDVTVTAIKSDEEISCLYCRFALSPDSPQQLRSWAGLIRDLCSTFGLRISVSDTESVGPDEMPDVVRRSREWRYFEGRYGWTEPPESNSA